MLLIVLVLLTNKTTVETNETTSDPTCRTGIRNGDLCCNTECNTIGCGDCIGEEEKDEKCCRKTVLENDRRCGLTIPPCIIKREMTLVEIIIIIVLSVIVSGCYIYVCCCFRKKRAPVDYDDIIGVYE